MYNSQIKVPDSYFKKDKHQYNNWPLAFVRELYQNSYDAKASRIDIQTYQDNYGVHYIFKDNGRGMSAETIKNALLTMGGSEKEEDSVGGFGQAKIIIYFSQLSYTIKTKNLLVEGKGGSYTITENKGEYIDGTYSHIVLDPKEIHDMNLVHYTHYIFESSNFKKMNVFLNGKKITKKKEKYEYTIHYDIGTLKFSYKKDQSFTTINIRIGDVYMFSHYTGSHKTNFEGVFDLNGKSTNLFTANRDSLKGEFAIQLSNILKELGESKSQIENDNDVTTIFNEDKSVYSSLKFSEEYVKKIDDVYEKTRINLDKTSIKEKSTEEKIHELHDRKNSLSHHRVFQNEIENLFEQIDTILEKIEKYSSDIFPKNFVVSINPKNKRFQYKLKQVKFMKLSIFWEQLIHYIFENINLDIFELKNNVPYFNGKIVKCGFILDEESLKGKMRTNDNGSYEILINPIDSSIKNYWTVFDIALHEITHLFEKEHNETFIQQEFELKQKIREFLNEKSFNQIKKYSLNIYKNKAFN